MKAAGFCVAIAIAVVAVATPAVAQMPFSGWIVPVVVKSPGLGGTSWASDIFLTNLGTERVELSAHYFKGGQANTFDGAFAKPNLSILPGGTLQVLDVIGTWFPNEGSQTKGWLFIADTGPRDCDDEDRDEAKVIVSTRVFNKAGGGATYGQIVEAMWTSLNTSQFPSVFTAVRNEGAVQPGFRTNLGVVNVCTEPIELEITLYRADGSVAARTTRTIMALSMEQWSLGSLGFPTFSSSGGRLEVRLTNPNIDPCADSEEPTVCVDLCNEACDGRYGFGDVRAFIAYASNVDNITGDGENMIPVIDQASYFEWVSEYIDANCPEEKHGRPFPLHLAELVFGVEESGPPTFTKVED